MVVSNHSLLGSRSRHCYAIKFELAWTSIAPIYTLKVISAKSSKLSGITDARNPMAVVPR
jgi:hypothetical protein